MHQSRKYAQNNIQYSNMNLTLKTERSHSLFDSEVSVSFDQVTKVLAAHGHHQKLKRKKIPEKKKEREASSSKPNLISLLKSNFRIRIPLNLLKEIFSYPKITLILI